MIPITVISMKHIVERRAFMKEQLDNLNLRYRFFDGIDGRAMSDIERNRAAPFSTRYHWRPLSPGEIGCALSHLAVLKQIANGESEFVAVLEDDVVLSPYVAKFLEERALRSLPRFDVLYLANTTDKKHRYTMKVGSVRSHCVRARLKCDYGMHATVYSRVAAQRIVATVTSITAPIDGMLFHYFYVLGLRILETHPAVVWQKVMDSTIGYRPQPTSIKLKIASEIRRYPLALRRLYSFVAAWGIAGVLQMAQDLFTTWW